ncbi:MAG: hypothetical protein QM756_16380 [Polyangiaceae bacterium]
MSRAWKAEAGDAEPTLSSVNLYLRMLGMELVLLARPKGRSGARAAEPFDDADEDARDADGV